jgi:beta-lactamase class C
MVAAAAAALALARAFAGAPAGFLPSALLAEATSDQSAGLDGALFGFPFTPSPWGLGVELSGTKKPHWSPQEASPGSFGHAGSSGCMAWVDPPANVAWALLGTRTFETWWPRWAEIGAAILAAPR